jgi:hypothetical protein
VAPKDRVADRVLEAASSLRSDRVTRALAAALGVVPAARLGKGALLISKNRVCVIRLGWLRASPRRVKGGGVPHPHHGRPRGHGHGAARTRDQSRDSWNDIAADYSTVKAHDYLPRDRSAPKQLKRRHFGFKAD